METALAGEFESWAEHVKDEPRALAMTSAVRAAPGPLIDCRGG
jgi:hypothetical protein